MASRDSPGSPLSSVGSLETSDHESMKQESRAHSPSMSNMPPSKRRRTGVASWDRQTPLSSAQDENHPPPSPTASISSDSSGEIPNSPSILSLLGTNQEEDYSGQSTDQVTICRWDGCSAGDLGNMDGLVQHLHNEHIGSRQKRYSCEWTDCTRKGQTHASAYALRAHMRSHTREKPFYCTLPECDRNFTRSDALTKHMRSVHETDTMRPIDSISKVHGAPGSTTTTPASKLQRIRLKLTQPREPGTESEPHTEAITIVPAPVTTTDSHDPDETLMPEFGPELDFDESELSLPPRDLYRLLRRQIVWAGKEAAQLQAEWETIRPQRERAWREKEAIFDDLIEAEVNLFNAMVGSVPPAHLTTSLEKLQQQQQQFQHQQEQLAKSADMPTTEGSA
ncbi:Zinc finger, C2H2 [Penicillium griseofulvum]|uniref:Zinc finger, C2H2 n=1 Tax=Penicillium patulum TaxID=5078 RepID=A0A135L9I6_PENPA|nr:Zinc finger, C2H2 [Penicillium griseofulvum]KXG45657.1 Zinc finger, C2H2 [Penicillium griseofulvum]